MNIVKTLQEYIPLSEQEKLYTYLEESAAYEVPTEIRTEELIALRTIAPHSMRFDTTLPLDLVRITLAKKLVQIHKELEQNGYGLHIFELYRDIRVQEQQFTEIQTQFAHQYPSLGPAELWSLTTQFIADPALTPPHCTGGAVDLTLYNLQTGALLDMGTANNDLSKKAQLMCEDISQEAKANRMILLRAMLAHQLAPMATEWWHFSYGEKYWGAFYNTHAYYDVYSI